VRPRRRHRHEISLPSCPPSPSPSPSPSSSFSSLVLVIVSKNSAGFSPGGVSVCFPPPGTRLPRPRSPSRPSLRTRKRSAPLSASQNGRRGEDASFAPRDDAHEQDLTTQGNSWPSSRGRKRTRRLFSCCLRRPRGEGASERRAEATAATGKTGTYTRERDAFVFVALASGRSTP